MRRTRTALIATAVALVATGACGNDAPEVADTIGESSSEAAGTEAGLLLTTDGLGDPWELGRAPTWIGGASNPCGEGELLTSLSWGESTVELLRDTRQFEAGDALGLRQTVGTLGDEDAATAEWERIAAAIEGCPEWLPGEGSATATYTASEISAIGDTTFAASYHYPSALGNVDVTVVVARFESDLTVVEIVGYDGPPSRQVIDDVTSHLD